METTRLELFADAVFAIAATLLIIDVSVDANDDELGSALIDAWPQYVAYASHSCSSGPGGPPTTRRSR